MLLRFNDVPRDATMLDETSFFDRKDSPRVVELIGRQAAVEAAYRKTGAKAIQAAIQGQPRALLGAIVFAGDEEDDDNFLRRIAERWETSFLPGYVRHEHYEILWHHLNWGAAHELRFFLPLWNRAEQVPLPVPKAMIDRSDLWTRVQALTFGLKDPFPRYRSGIRLDFQLAERGPNKGLRSALTAYIEDAVMAGELRSRREVIADLGKIGFEVAKEEPQALTVRYVGESGDLAQKAKRPVVLTGPAFAESFGQIDDPKLVEIEDAVKDGVKRLQAEAKAQSEKLAPGVEKAIQDAVERYVGDAMSRADQGLEKRLVGFQERTAQLAAEKHSEFAEGAKNLEVEAEATRRILNEQLVSFQKVARESKDALVEETDRDLAASVEVIKLFQKKLDAAQAQLDEQATRKDALIKKLTYGLVALGVIAVLLLVPSLYFSVGGARLVAEVKAASAEIAKQQEKLATLSHRTGEEVAQHRAALTHAVDLHNQVQEALQGMAQSLSILGDAVRIEKKADGTNALTIYTRKMPTVRNCDREPGCIARVDTRSN